MIECSFTNLVVLGSSPVTVTFSNDCIMSNRFKSIVICKKRHIPWDRDRIGIKFGTKYVIYQKLSNFYTKSYQVLHRKRISMLTGLKVSSLACKFVFYRSKHNSKGEHHVIQF